MLVTGLYELERERPGVSVLRSNGAPGRVDWSYRILNCVERILNQVWKTLIRNKSSATKCARNADVDYIERIGAEVLTELEKLVIANPSELQ